MKQYRMIALCAVIVALLLGGVVVAQGLDPAVFFGVQIAVPTQQATATPGLEVNVAAADGDAILVSADSTPVARVDKDGNVTAVNGTFSGTMSTTGASTLSSTLGVTGMSTLTGGATGVLGTENVMFPSVISASVEYSTTGAIFTIADGEIWLVHDVFIDISTSFDTGETDDTTISIGDGNDTDGLLALTHAECADDATEGTGWAAGWQGQTAASRGEYLIGDAGGGDVFIYAPSGAAETIDFAVGGTSPDAGAGTVYIRYTRIQ